MNIKFSLPHIDKLVINEVNSTLTKTGWLTSGPKVLEFESELSKYTGCKNIIAVSSWTLGAMLILKRFGIGPGDEVIIPSYTYSATALCVYNVGAKPVMVDVDNDFNISIDKISENITTKTKAIIAVDIGGWPANYKKIYEIILSQNIKKKFNPQNSIQSKLGRILLISDAAHSIGSSVNGINAGMLSDITIFSFHSVKNITTGEGGAICLNLPKAFDNKEEKVYLKSLSLHGQNKSAFEKNQVGSWKYDIIDQGLKCNMPDICAAIGLAQIKIYKTNLLPERKKIFDYYNNFFRKFKQFVSPLREKNNSHSSCHLYMLRILNFSEEMRDYMISKISSHGVAVNVHYIPMATFTFFKKKGFKIEDYPVTYNLYKNLITLPLYNGLTSEELDYVCKTVLSAYSSTVKYFDEKI